METLNKYLRTFFLVLSGCTISSTIFITIFVRDLEFNVVLLWEIIVMAAICTLGNLIYFSRSEISKKQMKVRMILHYFYINTVVLGCAFLFGWIAAGYFVQFLVILILIAAVYFGVMSVNFQKEEKAAENMNKVLRKLNLEEKERD